MSKEQKEGVDIWELIEELNNSNKEVQNNKVNWVWKNPDFTEQLNSTVNLVNQVKDMDFVNYEGKHLSGDQIEKDKELISKVNSACEDMGYSTKIELENNSQLKSTPLEKCPRLFDEIIKALSNFFGLEERSSPGHRP